MPRIAATASALLALTLGLATAAAASPAPAHLSAQQLLETLTVGAEQGAVTSKVSLSSSRTYTLVLSGTTASTFREVGVPPVAPYVERWDALYCYEGSPVALFAGGPATGCSPPSGPLANSGLFLIGPGTVGHLRAAGASTYPSYSQSHTYSVRFKPLASGRLSLVNHAYNFHKLLVNSSNYLGSTGSYTVKIYGTAARKKRKKKKRVGGCPAGRTSNTHARAAATCHWAVSFKVVQKGIPADSFPSPGASFKDSEAVSEGKVFFKAEPKKGRTSIGRAAGGFVHTDTYESPIPGFDLEGKAGVVPLIGTYSDRGDIRRLTLTGAVAYVEGPSYSQDRSGKSTEAGDGARISLLSDLPFHREDAMNMVLACAGCQTGAGGFSGFHSHAWRPDSRNKLRITISRPASLAGSCRCKS